jgi:hypothetical protein
MPFLINLVITFFSSAFTYLLVTFGKFFTKKIAIRATVIVLFAGFITAFMAAISAIVVGLAYSLPPEITLVAGWVLPSNAMQCLSAYYAAIAARWVYDIRMDAIRVSSYIT